MVHLSTPFAQPAQKRAGGFLTTFQIRKNGEEYNSACKIADGISLGVNEGTRGPPTMSQTDMEKLVTDLAEMGREGLVERLRGLECGFPMDFSDAFLGSLSLNRLRHVVLAACLQQHRTPQPAGRLPA